ncbi:MAG: acyltransferase [Hyphomonadaceae bacterium]
MSAAPHTANNFNLLRLAFALFVVVYHLVALSAVLEWRPFEGPLSVLAEIGVQGFFVLSGYLVYSSLDRSDSVRLYAEKRFRRLYPAYATVVIVCAAAGYAFSAEARANPVAVGQYLGWNLVFANFMAPELPGVFANNPMHEVNGALWTLKIEVMFYIVLPMLAWLLKIAGKGRWLLIVLIYAGAEVWRQVLADMGQLELSRQLPGQMSFFVTGLALYRLSLTGAWRHAAGVVGAGLLAASMTVDVLEPAQALGLGLATIWIAAGWPRLPDAARFGDLSYGVYIVHFPIIQTVIALGLFASPWIGAGLSLGGAAIAAFLLWHLVERPSLRRDSAYRAATA